MPNEKSDALPAGWAHGQLDARVAALAALPRRVQVLLAAEWARWVLSVFEAKNPGDQRPRKAIEAAERWAAEPSEATLNAAANAANAAYAAYTTTNTPYAAYTAYTAAYAAYNAANAANAAYNAAYAANAAAYAAKTDQKKKWRWLYATYRHARGPGDDFDPRWRTDTTVSLARGIRADRAFDRLPILADALQDAGCGSDETLAHLRTDRGEWCASEWALWNLLGFGDRQ